MIITSLMVGSGSGTRNSRGRRRLHANLMGLNMSRSAVTNLVSVVEDIGLPVEAVVSSAYAAGYALEERQRRWVQPARPGHQTTALSIWVGEELHHVACRSEEVGRCHWLSLVDLWCPG